MWPRRATYFGRMILGRLKRYLQRESTSLNPRFRTCAGCHGQHDRWRHYHDQALKIIRKIIKWKNIKNFRGYRSTNIWIGLIRHSLRLLSRIWSSSCYKKNREYLNYCYLILTISVSSCNRRYKHTKAFCYRKIDLKTFEVSQRILHSQTQLSL